MQRSLFGSRIAVSKNVDFCAWSCFDQVHDDVIADFIWTGDVKRDVIGLIQCKNKKKWEYFFLIFCFFSYVQQGSDSSHMSTQTSFQHDWDVCSFRFEGQKQKKDQIKEGWRTKSETKAKEHRSCQICQCITHDFFRGLTDFLFLKVVSSKLPHLGTWWMRIFLPSFDQFLQFCGWFRKRRLCHSNEAN